MTLPGEREFTIDLNGEAAVDTPLEQIHDAIADAVGQDVVLGVARGENNQFDRDVTGAVRGSSSLLAYGEQEPTVSQYVPGSGKLTRPYQEAVYVQGYLAERDTNVAVDSRLFSKILFLDAEVKPSGDFARSTVEGLVNIPADSLLTSGINLSNVSGSQAKRVVSAIRAEYAAGEWQNALQLAIATKHLGWFVSYAAEANRRDLDSTVVTVSDPHVSEVIDKEFGTDVLFLTLRALKAGIKDLQSEGRGAAASHGEQWLSLLEEGVLLDKFTPEMTTADVLAYPSYLNPQPAKGIPAISPVMYLAGGGGSRNHTIKYPNGDVYAVDYPTGEARPIKDRQENGFAGNLEDGSVSGFVHVKDGWVDFETSVDEHLTKAAIQEILQNGVSRKDLEIAYEETLREAAIIAGNHPKDIKTKVALGIALGQQLALAQTNPSQAVELFDYSVRGWGSKTDIEGQTGVSLTWKWESIEGLGVEGSKLYSQFGSSLSKFALTKLAEQHAGHPELTDKIAKHRSKLEATDDSETYLQEMTQLAQQLVSDTRVQEILNHSRLLKNNS